MNRAALIHTDKSSNGEGGRREAAASRRPVRLNSHQMSLKFPRRNTSQRSAVRRHLPACSCRCAVSPTNRTWPQSEFWLVGSGRSAPASSTWPGGSGTTPVRVDTQEVREVTLRRLATTATIMETMTRLLPCTGSDV